MFEQKEQNDQQAGQSDGTAALSLESELSSQSANVAGAERAVSLRPTAENLLDLSLTYYQVGRYQECISTARRSLGLRPQYAEAYNNISAAYHQLSDWDAAIEAAQRALRIRPDYRLAKNNLAQSLEQKKLRDL